MLEAQERAIKWKKNTPTKGRMLSFFHDFHRNCQNSCALNESEKPKATVSLETNTKLSIHGLLETWTNLVTSNVNATNEQESKIVT